MVTTSKLSTYFSLIRKHALTPFPVSLPRYLKTIYNSTDFSGKRVLEIGAGNGLHSFYAALKGASRVVAIEPEDVGSESGYLQQFRMLQNKLELSQVELFTKKFQEYPIRAGEFDIIISHYSINHLNEEACRNLQTSRSAQAVYLEIMTRIFTLASPGGQLIVADCSSHSLFSDLGVRNPFAPTIDWKTHQPPHLWQRLFEQVGFKRKRLHWLTLRHFGKVGDILLGNVIGSYLTNAHFSFTMEKLSEIT